MNDRQLDFEATIDAINAHDNGKGVSLTLDGVHGRCKVIGSAAFALRHVPSAKGKRSDNYRAIREKLGDDYESVFEVEWPEAFWARVEKLNLYVWKG